MTATYGAESTAATVRWGRRAIQIAVLARRSKKPDADVPATEVVEEAQALAQEITDWAKQLLASAEEVRTTAQLAIDDALPVEEAAAGLEAELGQLAAALGTADQAPSPFAEFLAEWG